MKRSLAQSFGNDEDTEALWCWRSGSIEKSISKDKNIHLTRKLLYHDRCTRGKQGEAQDLVLEREDQIHAATGHFDRGCYWFHMQQHSRALVELKVALNLYDRTPLAAELTVERQQDFLERKARCHYVLGLVMMDSTSQMGKAEKEVYRAWRISANYEQMESISKHAEHLMEVALSYKCGALEAHDSVICIKNAIHHEVSADYMYASGNLRLAIGEYRQCLVREEKESYLCTAQAHVRCKLAMAYQALEMLDRASYEWTTALSIYQHELGPDHSRTLATMKRLTANHTQRCRNWKYKREFM